MLHSVLNLNAENTPVLVAGFLEVRSLGCHAVGVWAVLLPFFATVAAC